MVRVKDRFTTCPSEGGWRDLMLNFYLKSDKVSVCVCVGVCVCVWACGFVFSVCGCECV